MKWTRAGGVAALAAAAAMPSCQKQTVTSVLVTEVIVEPAQASVVAGEGLWFSARVIDENDVLLSSVGVAWSSDDARIVSVDARGRADAISAGSTRVVATYQGVAGSAAVTVQPARCEPVYEAPKGKGKGKGGDGKGKKGKGEKGDNDDDDDDDDDDDEEDDEEDDEDEEEDDEEPECQAGPFLTVDAGPLTFQDPT